MITKTYTLHYRNSILFNQLLGKKRRDIFHHSMYKWVTIVIITDLNTKAIDAIGISKCSIKDNPSKKIGYNIAKGRALKNYGNNTDPSDYSHGLPVLVTLSIDKFFKNNKIYFTDIINRVS